MTKELEQQLTRELTRLGAIATSDEPTLIVVRECGAYTNVVRLDDDYDGAHYHAEQALEILRGLPDDTPYDDVWGSIEPAVSDQECVTVWICGDAETAVDGGLDISADDREAIVRDAIDAAMDVLESSPLADDLDIHVASRQRWGEITQLDYQHQCAYTGGTVVVHKDHAMLALVALLDSAIDAYAAAIDKGVADALTPIQGDE